MEGLPHYGFLYVMFSRRHNVSKLGFATSPPARLVDARRERHDDSIELVAIWSIWCCGEFVDGIGVEGLLHCWLAPISAAHPSQAWAGEWYETYWPNLVAFVESCGAIMAALDILIRRGRLEC